jgi:hypothetical protein
MYVIYIYITGRIQFNRNDESSLWRNEFPSSCACMLASTYGDFLPIFTCYRWTMTRMSKPYMRCQHCVQNFYAIDIPKRSVKFLPTQMSSHISPSHHVRTYFSQNVRSKWKVTSIQHNCTLCTNSSRNGKSTGLNGKCSLACSMLSFLDSTKLSGIFYPECSIFMWFNSILFYYDKCSFQSLIFLTFIVYFSNFIYITLRSLESFNRYD